MAKTDIARFVCDLNCGETRDIDGVNKTTKPGTWVRIKLDPKNGESCVDDFRYICEKCVVKIESERRKP